MAKKRGYAQYFPTRLAERIKREIRLGPAGARPALRAKCQRDGISLRALTLTLWWRWVRGELDTETETKTED